MPLGVVLLTCLSVTVAPGDEPKTKSELVSLKGLVKAAPLPKDYAAKSEEVRVGGKLLGHRVLVTKEQTFSKVLIIVDERPIKTRPERVAATKGYVNGTAQTLVKTGFKIAKTSIPDLDKANFDKRFVADFFLEKPDFGKLQVQLQIFFGKAGYQVQVISDNPKDFDALAQWARTIQE